MKADVGYAHDPIRYAWFYRHSDDEVLHSGPISTEAQLVIKPVHARARARMEIPVLESNLGGILPIKYTSGVIYYLPASLLFR